MKQRCYSSIYSTQDRRAAFPLGVKRSVLPLTGKSWSELFVVNWSLNSVWFFSGNAAEHRNVPDNKHKTLRE